MREKREREGGGEVEGGAAEVRERAGEGGVILDPVTRERRVALCIGKCAYLIFILHLPTGEGMGVVSNQEGCGLDVRRSNSLGSLSDPDCYMNSVWPRVSAHSIQVGKAMVVMAIELWHGWEGLSWCHLMMCGGGKAEYCIPQLSYYHGNQVLVL